MNKFFGRKILSLVAFLFVMASLFVFVLPAAGSLPSPTYRDRHAKYVAWIYNHRGKVVTSIPTDQKLIALTFDDGPIGNAKYYCDTLKKHNGSATFFMVGDRFGQYPNDAKTIKDCGSEVANHTWDHQFLPNTTLYKTWLSEFSKTDNLIYSMNQNKPYFIRARAGVFNDNLKKYAYNNNQVIINWNMDSHDSGSKSATKEQIINNVANSPYLKPGNIVLMHNSNSNTTDALDGLLTALEKKGYRVVTISGLVLNSK